MRAKAVQGRCRLLRHAWWVWLLLTTLSAHGSWQTVHRWTFAEPAPYADSVGAAHFTPTASGVSLVASGDPQLGQAVRVASGGNLVASKTALAPVGLDDFEVRLWVKREVAGVAAGLLDTLNGTETGFQLFFQANNTIRLRLDDVGGNTVNLDSTRTITADDQWHEVVVTVQRALPAGVVFRIDGQPEPPLDPSSVPGDLAPSQNLFAGNLNGTTALQGQLASVEIRVQARLSPPSVAISPAAGFLPGPAWLQLTSAHPAAVLRYTLDGTDPGPGSPIFTGPFLLATSVTVRAQARVEDLAGPVAEAAYVIAARPPSVLLVVAEDVGAGDLAAWGNPVHATPNLDRLCGEGLRFTQSYGTGPGNAPNQYAWLTARLLPRAGLPPFLPPGSGTGLASREWTLGKAFRKAGCRTAFIGGWHLGDGPSSLPHRQGFELFHGLVMPAEGAPLTPLRENDTVIEATPNPTNLLGQFVTRALSFLDAVGTNRFLLVLQVPPLPADGSSLGGAYGNRIEALDAAVGQLTASLAGRGRAGDTLCLFVSDEGPDLTATLPRGSPGMFLDGRGTTFEGGVRVPAVVSWPGVIVPGQVSQAIWWLPDLAPTLCALAGLGWPGDRPLDGTNRAAVLAGAVSRADGNERLFLHRLTNAAPNLAAQRWGAVKYHRSLTRTDPENVHASAPLLFDVERDPTERFPGLTGLSAFVPALDTAAAAHLATFQPPFPQLPPVSSLLVDFRAVPAAGSGRPLTLHFTRTPAALDEDYHLAYSTNLVDWTSVPLTALEREARSISDATETVTILPPAPLAGPVFYRLRVELP